MAKKNKRRGPAPVKGESRVKTPAEIETKAAPTPSQLSRRGGRETMDALVVAFVLAFLIRTFVAEAFVIPTGSMAPTLMGQHKDVFCDQCGTRFKVNSSDDTADAAAMLSSQPGMTRERLQRRLAGMKCIGGECPQCRYLMLLEEKNTDPIRPPWKATVDQTADYSGDRLVVSKYAYSFADPKRWDVAVFKYPGDSEVNYIKRVTGLPGEELRIFQGDLFTRPLGSDEAFQIARKPAKQVMAMRQFVHDTAHESAKLHNAGWPLAWGGEDGWKPLIDKMLGKSARGAEVLRLEYAGEAPAGETRWLRYRHRPPTENVWNRVLGEASDPITTTPPAELITDFTPYNTRLNLDQAAELRRLSLSPRMNRADDLGRLGLHWVSELMVEAEATLKDASTELSLDLVDAGEHFGVTIRAEDGAARFWRRAFESEESVEIAAASTPVRPGSSYRLRLANFDDRLLLWVNDQVIEADAAYETSQSQGEGPASLPRSSDTDEGDLAPVGVGVSGGGATVTRLAVWRDGYYLATNHKLARSVFTTDLPLSAFEPEDQRNWRRSIQNLSRDPELWYALEYRRSVDFPVAESQLFVMGDNSGHSLDARLWAGGNGRNSGRPGGPYLERTQLVGKAICVYWPHSWYSLPMTGRRVPAWPNFADMRLVR